MSSSPIEPENAASTASVRPGQGHKNSRDGKLPKTTQWNPPPRTKSASLLTQALATTYEVDEGSSTASTPLPSYIHQLHSESSTLQTETPSKEAQHHNGMTGGKETAENMTMVASLSAGNLRASLTLGNTPTSPSTAFDMNDVSAMLAHHRDFLGTTQIRGTSLERTAKEKRVQELPAGLYSTNPGDTGMIVESLPPRTPTSPDSISSNPPTDGMRAQYRSWRDVRPGIAAEKTWSIGGQGRDPGHGGQVEKSIGEALAGVEPNSRSRKASHSLGLFKEGLPDDKSNSRDSSNASRLRDVFTHSRALSAVGSSGLQQGQETNTRRPRGIESPSRPDWRSPSNSPFEDERPSSKYGLDSIMNPTDGLAPDTGYFDMSHSIETVTEEQIRKMPPNLLADIRKHHNLTPGATKGSSFSGSIPVPTSEKLQNRTNAEDQMAKSHLETEDDLYDGPSLSHVKSTDEGNDSGEEHVFRALFVPHQSNHQVQDVTGQALKADARTPAVKPSVEVTSQQWLEEHNIPSRDSQEKIEADTLSTPHIASTQDFSQETVTSSYHAETDPSTASTTDTALIKTEPITNGHSQYVHDHQLEVTEPLFAIELKPYRHQVGGHTTMWKFSKRAVCKLLNNRENEFYERIEHYHPKLLSFMPRYIGVLNVTYRKERRRSTRNGDNSTITASQEPISNSSRDQIVAQTTEDSSKANGHASVSQQSAPRMISQSLDAATQPIPTVTFADNRHIIPSNFLIPRPHLSETHYRAHSDSIASSTSARFSNSSIQPDDGIHSAQSTTTQNPWGKTNVNKQLRNEVFKDAFLAPVPIQPHKKPASLIRPLPSRPGATLRPSNSESSLKAAQQSQLVASTPQEDSIRKKAMKSAAEKVQEATDQSAKQTGADENPERTDANGDTTSAAEAEFDGRAGTSAPETEMAYAEGSSSGRRQRRYSSGGLRRKPTEVAESRGDLKYFEEADDAGYKGDVEDDVFSMDLELSKLNPSHPAHKVKEAPPTNDYRDTEPGTPVSTGDNLSTNGTLNMDLPRPVNPKEARARPDSRSEYFLLLEDLTCDMKRPCVMDLKMGTRQYGVEANEKKQKSQRRKCAETTSKQLGVRVCGVQVWDVSKHDYVFQDKYSGRNLKAGHEFQEALTRFLYNGLDYSSVLRHIPAILEELSQLELLVQSLAGYRFYAASLLMVYDGDVEDPDTMGPKEREERLKGRNIAVKMADFANCVTKEDFHADERPCPPRHPDLPDNGFLRGLRSLRRYFMMIERDICLKMGIDSAEFKIGPNEFSLDGVDEDDEGNISY
ncbi:SAICAR synthase-like protein [Mollisia scopiformis]|uniref:Kinase n=1 Tax=Mollisia scopiformis TaxID=149040 RepID=A0A194XRQ3_MOLSC|nr:SAICAR synthase-like protein [Mollisia scopiformis]KUJ22970.1 SAICAR synthase-like protein [Mollisia scopiformis]